MSTSKLGRVALAMCLALALASCGKPEPKVDWASRDEIPPERLSSVIEAHYRGLGFMERYEYAQAADAFREVHEKAPGWMTGTINLSIALLNQGGEAAAKAKAAGQGELTGAPEKNIDEAVTLLGSVLARRPDDPHAHFCRGIIFASQGRIEEAHLDFKKVTEVEPGDANAWLERGSTLTDPTGKPIGPGSPMVPELISCYEKALERNPNLTTATFKLAFAYRFAGKSKLQLELLARDDRMDPKKRPDGPGDRAVLTYGEMGKFARIINPFGRQIPLDRVAPGPKFAEPIEIRIALPEGHRWAVAADFQGPFAVNGRVRVRFGQGVATFDADGDGRLDLYLTSAVVGPKGLHDVLLRNRGDGQFEDATAAMGLPEDRAGLGVAAGDFDADRRVDLFLTGVGEGRLFRNLGKRFEDITKLAGIDGISGLSLTARWLDLDQDGDLDLAVINYCPAADADKAFSGLSVLGLANGIYRNDGKPASVAPRPEDNWAPLAAATSDLRATEGLSIAFSTAFPGLEALQAGKENHTALAALDIDEDRDIDLVVAADGIPPMAIFNDRLGAFHVKPLDDIQPGLPVSGLLVSDLDSDGHPDLVTVTLGGKVSGWLNRTNSMERGFKSPWESMPTNASDWRGALTVDLDLDMLPDLVGLPGSRTSTNLEWARNRVTKLESSPIPMAPGGLQDRPMLGFAIADLIGDALPDAVLVREGEAPRLARNLGNGNHWLAIELAGRWKTSFDHMRTNSEGIGARLSLEGQGIHVPYDHTTPSANLGQSVGPVVLGMGPNPSAPLLRVRWPDGVIQCELNVTADKTFPLVEQSRKTGSCPVLFTWNGARFECLGDFLGGGGLGYLVKPGVYGQPDRDESVAIAPNHLKAVDGVYRLSVVEPMDEVAYLDRLTLDVIDRPPGVISTPDERFAPEGPRPTGRTIAWSKAVEPVRATDHSGHDVTAEIRAWDRRTVDQFRLLKGWTGYAEDHSLILDFGDRLAGFPANRPLVLCLAGWVEYPYSQTNYAASTAGVTLHPPTLERQKPDGSWEILDPHPGYPAGLPRMVTLDLTGKLGGPGCVLRLTTNMECYWDQAFLALPDADLEIRTTSLPVARAELRYRGYLREVSPDGRLPLLYEYDYVDPAPLARMAGKLTRLGEVTPLLATDDDQVCTVGPGDEARLEFEAGTLPELAEGWTRSYVLRAVGYCKDADPFTAGSDSIEPLPWKTMPPYPFETKLERPVDPDYAAYLREYQTRPAGVR